MSPRRHSSFRSRGPRPRYQWITEFGTHTVGAINAGLNTDLFSAFLANAGSEVSGATIERIHMRCNVSSAVAAGDGFIHGIAVMPKGNAGGYTTGGGVFVNPIDTSMYPWMMIDQRGAHPGYSTDGPNNNLWYDVKVKRRIHGLNETLIYSVVNTGAVANLSLVTFWRILLRMP